MSMEQPNPIDEPKFPEDPVPVDNPEPDPKLPKTAKVTPLDPDEHIKEGIKVEET
jgi:hypothetical protein